MKKIPTLSLKVPPYVEIISQTYRFFCNNVVIILTQYIGYNVHNFNIIKPIGCRMKQALCE